MKRWIAGALLTLAGCGGQGDRWPAPSPALWEVTGPGGQHAWLFGTVHSLPDGMKWHTAKVDDALAKASVLVVEIADLSDAEAARASFYRFATTPDQPPLIQRVPEASRPAVSALLRQAGLSDADFRATETWAAALVLAARVDLGDPANGVDRALIGRARRVVGLETFDGQYGIFDRLPAADQADLLVATARDAGANAENREATEWLTGDTAALERDSATGVLADPQLRQALQIDRNLAWGRRIEQMLADGETPFVAVGAAHMFGGQGLPALLAAHGYTVRREE